MPLTHKQKHRRKVAKYRADRKAFIAELGGRCVQCGRKTRLEFDHTRQRDWEPSRFSRWSRLLRYKRDHAAGRTIVLRCRWCNASKGKPEETEPSGECGFCGSAIPDNGYCTCA